MAGPPRGHPAEPRRGRHSLRRHRAGTTPQARGALQVRERPSPSRFSGARSRLSGARSRLSGAREASHATPQRERRSTAACPSLRCARSVARFAPSSSAAAPLRCARSVARHAPACAKEYSRMPGTKTSDKSWKTRSRSANERRSQRKLTEQAHAISKRRGSGHDGTDLR